MNSNMFDKGIIDISICDICRYHNHYTQECEYYDCNLDIAFELCDFDINK